MIEAAAAEVAECEMSEINVAEVPCATLRFIAALSLPEKCKFKTERPAVGVLDVACRVPPFGLKFGMGEEVAWEFVTIAGQRSTVRRIERREDRKKKGCAEGATLHGQPRRD